MVVEDAVGAMGMSIMARGAAYYDDNGHGLNPEIFAALIFKLGEFRGVKKRRSLWRKGIRICRARVRHLLIVGKWACPLKLVG